MDYPCSRCKKIRGNHYAHYIHICDNCPDLEKYEEWEIEQKRKPKEESNGCA